jgi:hypothetical protein
MGKSPPIVRDIAMQDCSAKSVPEMSDPPIFRMAGRVESGINHPSQSSPDRRKRPAKSMNEITRIYEWKIIFQLVNPGQIFLRQGLPMGSKLPDGQI